MISLFRLNCRSFCVLHQHYYYCYFRSNLVIAFQPSRERLQRVGNLGNFCQIVPSFHAPGTMLTHWLSAATAKKKPADLLYSPRFEHLNFVPQSPSHLHSQLPLKPTNGVLLGVEAFPVSSVSLPLVRASFLLRDSSNPAASVNADFGVS